MVWGLSGWLPGRHKVWITVSKPGTLSLSFERSGSKFVGAFGRPFTKNRRSQIALFGEQLSIPCGCLLAKV